MTAYDTDDLTTIRRPPRHHDPDQLITLTDLCRLLRLTRRAVDKRRKSGTLGIAELNIGGDGRQSIPRFRRRDVENYLRSREV